MYKYTASVLFATSVFTASAFAGGVGLGATRMIYSSAVTQAALDVRNTHKDAPFLIQSWIENEQGQRSNDFVITPPLYVLKPVTESVIKVMFNGKALPQDRETLYWLTVKAIPQQDKHAAGNTLQFASANRIKVFYRPAGLHENAIEAWKQLRGEVRQGKITLTNPTPYYLTTINLSVDGKAVNPVMIPPKASVALPGSFGKASTFSYQTINDYGAWTPSMTSPLVR
ncbi:fimbria/pilus periplasmic chaperone [Rahnella victoriana]|uniref:fimbria/pilus periplasmic chaperone n=1 Tax=Rahnella victoriana TaxID=1510570 RepID=UPI001E565445|nr:fimbria/pilus periplasmic chaperone [Rahnella victoriana]UHM89175.1 fimbria/pilus periplasmic chaperone [Rahnella victoriana]